MTLAPEAACAAVERDFAGVWWLLAEGSRAELHESDGLRWYHTGRDDPYANAVVVTELEGADADAAIDAVLAELRSRGATFTWWHMPGASPPDLGERLAARGLVPDRPWRGMAMAIEQVDEPFSVEGLAINRVTNEAEFDTFLEVFAPILSSSDAFTAFFRDAARGIGFGADAPAVHLLGLLDGAPVATTTVLTAAGAAGIYNVTTREAARGRGIGASMTSAAVALGRQRGMSIATLQASDMGRPVYERLGFGPACDLIPFRPA